MRLSLDADERIDPHHHPERDSVLHALEGAIELDLDEETFDLNAGDITRFEGEREASPHAVERSVALIVLAPRADSRSRPGSVASDVLRR
ncbi:cupin domain-containing protein [Halorhabdus rudnickae]|uniref:cupin domain-containing protein n=1 Tax=Halorhabdus rudnickae TaxID=1775544 RepID=UPI001083098A